MMQEKFERLNKLYLIIYNFQEYFNEEFEKTNIKKCDKCHSGLKNKHNIIDNFCDYCGGIGYLVEKMKGEYMCRWCRGGGCSFCAHKGTVDWVKHAMGSDISTMS